MCCSFNRVPPPGWRVSYYYYLLRINLTTCAPRRPDDLCRYYLLRMTFRVGFNFYYVCPPQRSLLRLEWALIFTTWKLRLLKSVNLWCVPSTSVLLLFTTCAPPPAEAATTDDVWLSFVEITIEPNYFKERQFFRCPLQVWDDYVYPLPPCAPSRLPKTSRDNKDLYYRWREPLTACRGQNVHESLPPAEFTTCGPNYLKEKRDKWKCTWILQINACPNGFLYVCYK